MALIKWTFTLGNSGCDLNVPYGKTRPGISGRCVTKDITGPLRQGTPGMTFCECVPWRGSSEGNRITANSSPGHFFLALKVGGLMTDWRRITKMRIAWNYTLRLQFTLWRSYCSKRWKTSGDTRGVGDCRQATTTKIRSVWKCMVRLHFTQCQLGGLPYEAHNSEGCRLINHNQLQPTKRPSQHSMRLIPAFPADVWR